MCEEETTEKHYGHDVHVCAYVLVHVSAQVRLQPRSAGGLQRGALDKWKKGQKVEIEGVAIGAAGEDDSFPDMINKMYSTVKTHRNIIDLDWSFCVDGTEFLA